MPRPVQRAAAGPAKRSSARARFTGTGNYDAPPPYLSRFDAAWFAHDNITLHVFSSS